MWTLRSEDRLKEWKAFRRELDALSFDEAVAKTVNLWSYAPFVLHYLDHSGEPADWPGPWELLVENKYDDMAKALGMIYTLHLTKHGKDHTFELVKAQAGSNLEGYNLVLIDQGKYVLNYAFNEVISNLQLDKDVVTTKVYSSDDLQLHKY
jgi:hypothetical protein